MFTDIALYNHHHNFKTFFSLWEKKKKAYHILTYSTLRLR